MSPFPEQVTPSSAVRDTLLLQPLPQATSRVRLFFLDHLRVMLTILVVLHHIAAIYGAVIVFYYVEPPGAGDSLMRVVFAGFLLINQAYFMGLFFLISGYFTPGSFDRKGPGAFYKDRLLRLGIPLAVYVLILSPIVSISPYLSPTPADMFHLAPPYTWQKLPPHAFGVGPLWFAEMLLLFGLGYVIWRLARRTSKKPAKRTFSPPGYLTVCLFVLMLAALSYLMRIVIPLSMSIPIVGFPSLAYLPQYLSFFILGIFAFRRNWLQTIPGSMGKVGFVVALVATIVLAPLALSAGDAFLGHGTLQSAAYALWDSTFSVGICLALLTFFRRFFNRQTRFDSFLSQQAFTVYIIHIPVIVLLALALRGVHLESLLKFALVALIGVPLCFVFAFLVRKIPFASRVF